MAGSLGACTESGLAYGICAFEMFHVDTHQRPSGSSATTTQLAAHAAASHDRKFSILGIEHRSVEDLQHPQVPELETSCQTVSTSLLYTDVAVLQ